MLKPQQKRMILFLALIAPGLLPTIWAFSQYPSDKVPVWIPFGWGFYMLAAIMFMTIFGARIIKSPVTAAPSPDGQASATGRVVWLLAVWSALLLYGVIEVFKGHIPAGRAIPAGVLLSAWILAFGWLARRDMKSRPDR